MQVNIKLLVGVFVLSLLELFGNQCIVDLEGIKGVLWKANYLGVSLCLTFGDYWFGEGQNTRQGKVYRPAQKFWALL